MRKQFVLLFLTSMSYIYAQDIEVKKFEPLVKDQTATLSPRKDINGTECGLVKVALKEPGAEFEGNVMGDVQFTGKDYLVYLPDGTKRLGIKHPDYLPTTVVFADYGTKKVASKTTYQLKVKANKKKAKVDKSKKGIAVFNIKPSNAMLLINGQIADGSGGAYTLSLPYGTHYYTVKLRDFSINNQMLHIDKHAKNINIDLTEFYAKVNVSCKTTDAEILVNNEQKGIGKWGGMVIPGKYIVEAKKDGCHSQTRQIELNDNDYADVAFPALKTITGSLRVDYKPAGADVLLNGKKVGVTPLVLKDLPVGNYQLEIWKEYYVKEFATVMIAEDQEWKEEGELELTEFGNIALPEEGVWLNGRHPDGTFPWPLILYYRTGAAPGYRFDTYTCDRDTFVVSLNPVKGVYWLKKAASLGDESAIERLKPFQSFANDDNILSFEMAKKYVEETDEGIREMIWYVALEDASLAWHYCYGIGCKKDINEARRLMKLACKNKGIYFYPAYKQLVKDLEMDSELKFVKLDDWLNQ